jgi:hypothetical protein
MIDFALAADLLVYLAILAGGIVLAALVLHVTLPAPAEPIDYPTWEEFKAENPVDPFGAIDAPRMTPQECAEMAARATDPANAFDPFAPLPR